MLRIAAALHDIGKLHIPKNIRDKPGELEAREYEVMKTHTKLGAAILSSIQGEIGVMARTVCLHHHEWHDPAFGGYWGIPAHTLPGYVPIVSITDVLTALVSERSYKAAWKLEDALAFINKQAGTQFSAELVDFFVPLIQSDNRVPAIFTEGS